MVSELPSSAEVSRGGVAAPSNKWIRSKTGADGVVLIKKSPGSLNLVQGGELRRPLKLMLMGQRPMSPWREQR